MLRTFALIIGLLFTIPSFTFGQQVPDYIVGSWTGHLKQEGKLDTYWVALSITKGTVGEVVGYIDYGEDMCGGELSYIGLNENGFPQFEESITRNPYRCYNDGIITITPSDELNQLVFDWKHPNNYLFSACAGDIIKVGQ